MPPSTYISNYLTVYITSSPLWLPHTYTYIDTWAILIQDKRSNKTSLLIVTQGSSIKHYRTSKKCKISFHLKPNESKFIFLIRFWVIGLLIKISETILKWRNSPACFQMIHIKLFHKWDDFNIGTKALKKINFSIQPEWVIRGMHCWLLLVLLQQNKTEVTAKEQNIHSSRLHTAFLPKGICLQIGCASSHNKVHHDWGVVPSGVRSSFLLYTYTFSFNPFPLLYTLLKFQKLLYWTVFPVNTLEKVTSGGDGDPDTASSWCQKWLATTLSSECPDHCVCHLGAW